VKTILLVVNEPRVSHLVVTNLSELV
jgi:hypothetical protein